MPAELPMPAYRYQKPTTGSFVANVSQSKTAPSTAATKTESAAAPAASATKKKVPATGD